MSPYAICVITTIQQPTAAVRALQSRLAEDDVHFGDDYIIVVGDKKGPAHFALPHTRFLSLDDQLRSNFKLAPLLPTGHYTRKNLGYLEAFARNSAAIYETDDDNAPANNWFLKTNPVNARAVCTDRWFNVYRCFTKEITWPRGFPLAHAHQAAPYSLETTQSVDSPIQQLLCNIAPDMDAVWRLAIANEPFTFHPLAQDSIYLPPGTWSPFNSQATWWFREAFPLMYLPSTCTFRMTDIWRSFIAQRCLWELNMGVTFHPPEVIQERNPHDLMKDFEDEIPGYLLNDRIAQILTALALKPGKQSIIDNLIHCYEALINAHILKSDELPLLRAWVDDISPLLCLPSSS
jgi:hypothetical protein